MCHETLERKRGDLENNNKDLDILDFLRTGSLSQDAMMTKEKLNFDKHDMRIICTADDIFNKKRIDLELKLLLKKYENETTNNSNEQADESYETDETSVTFKKGY